MLEVPDPAVVEGHPPISAEEPPSDVGDTPAPWRENPSTGKEIEESAHPTSQNLIEDIVEQAGSLHTNQRQSRSSGPTVGEQRVLQARFRELKKLVNK